MSEDAKAQARALALDVIRKYRDGDRSSRRRRARR